MAKAPAPSEARSPLLRTPPERGAYYAHSAPSDSSHPHRLDEHLRKTGDRAARSLERVGLADLGRSAGLLHDLGKYTTAFQERLDGGRRVDHSTAGAQESRDRYPFPLGKMVAFCVAGHHAGLANGVNGDRICSLEDRLKRSVPTPDPIWRQEIALPELTPPEIGRRDRAPAGFTASFRIRLLFSALVDADYLDTEAYYAEIEGTLPARGQHPSLQTLRGRLDRHLAALTRKAPKTAVNDLRGEVLGHARKRAAETPGLFTLTVPTGGGKTLTSLAFALDHAVQHDLERVIYVIPYTNIIEQTADVFRDALGGSDGADFIVEHHSTFDEEQIGDRWGREKLKLAMENWDAPIIVTTAVQFFESLFSNRPSRCRKLHNIAGSVVILDEAQTMPLRFLRPCVAAMDELARNWKTSVVLCTATQPALTASEFQGGLCNVRELAPDPARLQRGLRRTRVRHEQGMDDAEIAERLRSAPQALCIVNLRAHARTLFESVRDLEGATHLTTCMCAAHRRNVLAAVRSKLSSGEPVRLIATSLVEAGVDLDFPEVWRAEAGLESIIQAAGRCNREGKRDVGDVFVFRPSEQDGARTPQEIEKAARVTRSVLRRHGEDPTSLDAIRDYFEKLYWAASEQALDTMDAKNILAMLGDRADTWDFPFERIAQKFRLIETAMVPVIVPYRGPTGTEDRASRLIAKLRHIERPGALARLLQPYTVPLPPREREALLRAGAAQIVRQAEFGCQFVELGNYDIYHQDLGLTWDDPTFRDAAGLVR